MVAGIVEVGNLKATVSGETQLTGVVEPRVMLRGEVGIPRVTEVTYAAGNGIIIENKVISLDELILDCGTSTTVI